MLHLYGKMMYDEIQLAYVANQTCMVRSWFNGEQMPRNITRSWMKIDSVIVSEDDEDAEMSHGELLYCFDESDVDDDDWR